VAMVFQSYALYPHLSVRENIGFGLKLRKVPKAELNERVEATAKVLGLSEYLDLKPRNLSGGQRQRVAMGRAIVREPQAFLMDEPLSNLDAKLRVHMRTEIAQLHRRLGATFVYVTHDQAEAMTMSDRIAVMMDGAILQVDAPDTVYRDPLDLRVAEFIGSPKINVLPATVTDAGRVAVCGGMVPVAVAAAPGTDVMLAFRCEHGVLAAPQRGAFRGRVAHLENLGSDLLVHIHPGDAGDPPIVLRCAPDGPRPGVGDTVGIGVSGPPLIFGADGRRVPLAAPRRREAAHV